MDFLKKLQNAIDTNNSLLCVGLDTDATKIKESQFNFNKSIIDQTHDLVCCYKIQSAYYEALGPKGMEEMQKTVRYINKSFPIPVIYDAKRADIASTSEQYAVAAFDTFEFDAITVNPYLGKDALLPFLKRKDKGIILICHTSNPGAADFQDLEIKGKPLYQYIAERVVEWNTEYNNCLMVVGAVAVDRLKKVRETAPDMFLLAPGIGAQGGDLETTMRNGLRKDKSGLIIHSSRSIIYAENPKNTARKLRDAINTYR